MQLVVAVLLIIFCLKPKHAFVPRLDLSGFPSQPEKPLLMLWIYILIGFTTYPKFKKKKEKNPQLIHFQINKAVTG